MTCARASRLLGTTMVCAGLFLAASASTGLAAAQTRPLVIAHRGGAALMPENTFPAFDNALRLGVDWLEFDIQMTADDQLVVTHDGTVNATFCMADPGTGVTAGPIRAMKLSHVLKFDCGAKHRALYPTQQAVPGAHMPTLDAMLRRYKGAHAVLFGETKFPGSGEGKVDPVAFTNLVATEIRKYGLEDQFILQSANLQSIDAMHEADPRVRTCILYPWLAKTDYLQLAREHHASCILLRLQDADAAEVKRLRDAGITVISDVVDDDKSWSSYLAAGFSAIFTNNPAALNSYLSRVGASQK